MEKVTNNDYDRKLPYSMPLVTMAEFYVVMFICTMETGLNLSWAISCAWGPDRSRPVSERPRGWELRNGYAFQKDYLSALTSHATRLQNTQNCLTCVLVTYMRRVELRNYFQTY